MTEVHSYPFILSTFSRGLSGYHGHLDSNLFRRDKVVSRLTFPMFTGSDRYDEDLGPFD